MDVFAKIRSALGRPYYETDSILLYQGDCLDLLATLPDCCVPLTVTSPPYNIGKEYEIVRSIPEYLDWCESWIKQVFRVSKRNGAFWLNLGYLRVDGRAKAIPLPYLIWERVPFYLIQEVVWNYGAGVAGRKFFSPRNEKLLWYVKNPDDYTFNLDDVRDPNVKYPNQKKGGKFKCNQSGKNPTDVWQIPKVTSGHNRASKERTEHPAQFPTSLVDRIIRASSHKAEVVLDPFMGSGSLADAAIRSGRRAVGFEINPAYLDIAAERLLTVQRELEDRSRQSSLFDPIIAETM